MLTPEEHTALLRRFEVDRLLKLMTLEAKRSHDGHYTIFAFTTGYKVAFGTPSLYPVQASADYQLRAMPSFPTLKEAMIAALVTGKDFEAYFTGDGEAAFAAEMSQQAACGGPPCSAWRDGTIMFFCELCGGSVDVDALPEGWDGMTSPSVCATCLPVLALPLTDAQRRQVVGVLWNAIAREQAGA